MFGMIEGARLSSAPASPAVRSDETGEVGAGHRLGNYEVLQRLAAGGMAEIFLARAVGVLGFDKLVVIKRVLPHLASRSDFVEMFLDEARVASTLTHANIVQTHEVGTHGKSYFMVMEYLAGEDIRTIVRSAGKEERRVPLAQALQIAIGVAAGLHYAHEKKDREGKPLHIVHRDVTPQNVIVTWDGAVKLLDFGIAKAANRLNETRSGSFKGKVPYMSPEQCRGDALDRRSDIFSLGILLHEMTLGRRLFRGDTDFQILKQIAEGPIPRPRDIDPSYDQRLDAIVMKALERDPARRFQTARELQVALEELAYELRLRLSPIALGDFMHEAFADKIKRWEQAAAGDDVEKLEQHLLTVMAEREADLSAEEKEPVPRALGPASLPPIDMLPELPDGALLPPRRWPLVLAGMAVVAVIGGGAWLVRGHGAAQPAAVIAPTAAATETRPTELPGPESAPAPAGDVASATIEVTTTPPGAELVLDGVTRPERSPARLSGIAPNVSHTLAVRMPGHPGVAQRFQLDAGEEATMEIDLRRAAQHGGTSLKRTSSGAKGHAAAPAVAAATPAAAPAPVAAPVKQGDGTLVVASSPWCNVTVDGQARGTTPLSVKLKAGSHDVVLSNPEFKIKRTLAVEVEPGQTVRKSLDFAPE